MRRCKDGLSTLVYFAGAVLAAGITRSCDIPDRMANPAAISAVGDCG